MAGTDAVAVSERLMDPDMSNARTAGISNVLNAAMYLAKT
jgi:hypothetical protein